MGALCTIYFFEYLFIGGTLFIWCVLEGKKLSAHACAINLHVIAQAMLGILIHIDTQIFQYKQYTYIYFSEKRSAARVSISSLFADFFFNKKDVSNT